LRTTQGTNSVSVYENFVQAHADQVTGAHFGAYFLPWHRQMLYEFELALNRVATPGATISIPYWDWSAVYTNFKRDFNTWGKMGGATQGQAIPNLPFRGWTSRIDDDHSVIRGFTVGDNVPTDEFLTSPETLDALIRRRDAFAVMSETLEGIHNSPHISIGGDMNNLRVSPNDPIFYSHHAFVDLIWRRWQRAGSGNAFGGTHPGTSNIPATLDQRQQPWGRTVREILETLSRCSQYQIAGGPIRQGYNDGIGGYGSTSPASSGYGSNTSAPTTTGYGSPTKPVNTTTKPTTGYGPGYGAARLDGNMGKQPIKFASVQAKREAQRKAAEFCVKHPERAQKTIKESTGARDWIVVALKRYNYSESQIQFFNTSYNTLELERGYDLKAVVPNATAAEVAKSGQACLSAISAGQKPPRTDDSDISNHTR
jgi:hypothetical protein